VRTIFFFSTQNIFLDPPKKFCKITGNPAKYFDPATGFGYADLGAYKILQEK
jgi:hypothetical protein